MKFSEFKRICAEGSDFERKEILSKIREHKWHKSEIVWLIRAIQQEQIWTPEQYNFLKDVASELFGGLVISSLKRTRLNVKDAGLLNAGTEGLIVGIKKFDTTHQFVLDEFVGAVQVYISQYASLKQVQKNKVHSLKTETNVAPRTVNKREQEFEDWFCESMDNFRKNKKRVESYLKHLKPSHQFIIIHGVGLKGKPEMSLSDINNIVGFKIKKVIQGAISELNILMTETDKLFPETRAYKDEILTESFLVLEGEMLENFVLDPLRKELPKAYYGINIDVLLENVDGIDERHRSAFKLYNGIGVPRMEQVAITKELKMGSQTLVKGLRDTKEKIKDLARDVEEGRRFLSVNFRPQSDQEYYEYCKLDSKEGRLLKFGKNLNVSEKLANAETSIGSTLKYLTQTEQYVFVVGNGLFGQPKKYFVNIADQFGVATTTITRWIREAEKKVLILSRDDKELSDSEFVIKRNLLKNEYKVLDSFSDFKIREEERPVRIYGVEVKKLAEHLNDITRGQQVVFAQYYGIKREPVGLTQIAKDLGIQRSSARRALLLSEKNLIKIVAPEKVKDLEEFEQII